MKILTLIVLLTYAEKTFQQTHSSVTLNSTRLTNIFIPHGDLVTQTNYATLRISLNITTLFEESQDVCKITALMTDSMKKLLGNNKKISPSNRKILHILQEGLQNLCQDDLDSLAQLRDVFNLVDLPPKLIKSLEDYDNLVDHHRHGGQLSYRNPPTILLILAANLPG